MGRGRKGEQPNELCEGNVNTLMGGIEEKSETLLDGMRERV